MADLARAFVREPGVESPQRYAQRVRLLAAIYLILFVVPIAGIVLIVWHAQLYVTLAQRSNVETLTLAFLLLFFAYVALLSAPGAVGAVRVYWYGFRWRRDPDTAERAKLAAIGKRQGDSPAVVLNLIVEREDRPCQPFEVAVADRIGSMGKVVLDGARVTHQDAHRDGSNDLLAFFVHQLAMIIKQRGVDREPQIVQWKKVDDEATEEYACLVQFARNLERKLGGDELWPKVTLQVGECAELERRLSAICPALRDEAFLPDWEYSGEHKLPLIPEPLGLITLSRSERRADPVASMGCASIVVIVATIIVAIFILFPPWVPGA